MKRVNLAFISATLAAALTSSVGAQTIGTVGIALPTDTSPRWVKQSQVMVDLFTEAGYGVDLRFAQGDVAQQRRQIAAMIASEDKVLVIAAIEGAALAAVLDSAAKASRIIAYDTPIRGSGRVDYLVAFDHFQLGVQQADSLISGLKQRFPGVRPWNVQLTGGEMVGKGPNDAGASLSNQGAMSVLQPLIEAGGIVLVAGQSGQPLHGLLIGPQAGSTGVVVPLKTADDGSGALTLPVVTGQGADLPSVRAIIAGDQYSTQFMDSRELAKAAAGMVNALMHDAVPSVNDTTSHDNGVRIVPAYQLVPVMVDASNYQTVLVDSGYLNAEDVQ